MKSSEPILCNILIAYPYWSKQVADLANQNRDRIRLVIDSGAFTAWKAGTPIGVDDYCKFIENLPIVPWRYFTLDVIGDPHASMKNYEVMLKRGFTPVPIFTRGEDPSVLDDYYKTSDVVGIGGLVGTQQNKGFVNGIMRHVNGRRVHWLGFTGIEYLKFYRPYMCDSSSWEGGARFGAARLYMGNGRFMTINKKDFSRIPEPSVQNRIRQFGFDINVFSKMESWHGGRSLSRALCAASGLAMSVDVQKNLGTFIFNACATSLAIEMFIDAYKFQVEGMK